MANQRRRGKSVVFDALPSFVTADDDGDEPLARGAGSHGAKFNREALREIVLVLVGLALVVWLFFGGLSASHQATGITLGGRTVEKLSTPYLIPAHFAGSAAGARDSVVKAPGDKQGQQGQANVKNSPLYQVTGYDAAGDKIGGASHDPKKPRAPVVYQFAGPDEKKLVILTILDDIRHPREYLERIVQNRLEYATAHKYGLLIKFASDYIRVIEDAHNASPTWARVALCREAMLSFPQAHWFWYLDETALIMDSQLDVHAQLLAPDQLGPRMLRSEPVMRYENTHIVTYRNNRAEDVSLVFCHDTKSLNTDSFFFKNTVAARSMLEIWAEPLYRSSPAMQNAEDALGHLMLWHTQYLLRSALVDARYIASLALPDKDNIDVTNEVAYQAGDFVAVVSCDYTTEPCKHEFERLWNQRVRVAAAFQSKDQQPAAAQDHVQQQVQVQAQKQAQEKAEKEKAAEQQKQRNAHP